MLCIYGVAHYRDRDILSQLLGIFKESVNKMGSANLALIFAPCILRSNQSVHAQEQLHDVNRQAICVQALIDEKLRQFRVTVTHIVTLEHASEKVG